MQKGHNRQNIAKHIYTIFMQRLSMSRPIKYRIITKNNNTLTKKSKQNEAGKFQIASKEFRYC